jgi:hypothetical protein
MRLENRGCVRLTTHLNQPRFASSLAAILTLRFAAFSGVSMNSDRRGRGPKT